MRVFLICYVEMIASFRKNLCVKELMQALSEARMQILRSAIWFEYSEQIANYKQKSPR